MKCKIKLTESDLHRIVKESVKKILKEAMLVNSPHGNDKTYVCVSDWKVVKEIFKNGLKVMGRGYIYGPGIYTYTTPEGAKNSCYPYPNDGVFIIECQLLNPDSYEYFENSRDAYDAVKNGELFNMVVNSRREGKVLVTRSPKDIEPVTYFYEGPDGSDF